MRRRVPIVPWEVIPPKWVTPSEEPSTGWLSPEGVLYACAPWGHSTLAAELTHEGNLKRPAGAPHVQLYDRLENAGWLHVGRESSSIREATGGVFYIRGRHLPTDAQAAVLRAWMDTGNEVVDLVYEGV